MKASTPIDNKEGFDLAINNANDHFNAAELIAKDISYGIANSHLILAAEEAVKAYMIFVRAYEPEREITNYDKFFGDHKHKHKALAEISFSMILFQQSIDIISKPLLEYMASEEDDDTDDIDGFIKARNKGFDDLITWLKTMPKIENNKQWWNDANKDKNDGFYVGNVDSKWRTPKNVTLKDYQKSHKIVKEILEAINRLKEFETNPMMQTIMKEYKEKMKKKK